MSQRFSEDRLGTSRRHGKSHAEVLELDEWNPRVGGSLFEALELVEVVLRNVVHETSSRATHQCPSARWWETVDLETESR